MPDNNSTMYPSLAAMSTREAITEYLATTFALTDSEVAAELRAFLEDADGGIFRGPFVRLRLPFLAVDDGWQNPLGWLPGWFHPYRHQATAFERLSSLNSDPQPTLVTTGTGSGKTESFLMPLLDHARRARAAGEGGIKAIVLYPMNALVTDQARRIAELIDQEPELAGVTAGVYIGGAGKHSQTGPDHLIDMREELRTHPPDILLTNYRMLDLLLLREADAALWKESTTSLRYIVLDEFHTYDGAQGTDVAMLLRRLGATLGVAGSGGPLGRICPVATSATLGSGSRSAELRGFAETVFGTPFPADAVIGEERHSADQLFGDLDFGLSVPDPQSVLDAPLPEAADPESWQPLAEVFLGIRPTNTVQLGALLQQHILTRAVASAIGGGPLPVPEAVREVARAGALSWGVLDRAAPEQSAEVLLRFLALLSAARTRSASGKLEPLVNVEVQVWAREVSRVLRAASDTPRFTWWSDGAPDPEVQWLPAVFCRSCGSAGWQAQATELGDALETNPTKIWQGGISRRGKQRTLIPASADLPEATRFDSRTMALDSDGDLPVLVTPDEKAAEAQRCPSCQADEAIRFIGTAVSTLVSVGLTQLFGLSSVPESEKKTLVFTDSVQDAAHRAAFVEGRAFQFNFRSAVLRALGSEPRPLDDVTARLMDSSEDDLYVLAPPDFVQRQGFHGRYLAGHAGRRELLGSRLAFQTHLEAGLRSRVGRTLELTGSLGVHVELDGAAAVALVRSIHENLPLLARGEPSDRAYHCWLQGVLDRLRTRGGIMHPWLLPYIKDDGNRWKIWGGSPPGMQKFPRGQSAPVFFTDRRSEAFDTIASSAETWLNDWTRRCLELPTDEAGMLLSEALPALAEHDGVPLRRWASKTGASIYGLTPEGLVLTPGRDDEALAGRLQMACPECHHIQPTSSATADDWEGSPCPRMRCPGRLAPAPVALNNFYRRLYRSGRLRRIVAREHTGLLDRADREAVEKAFKGGSSPDDPNVLACTPTLELGIDIGTLSSVTLSSLPRTTANYLQRVGRAGRSNGNALILATVPTAARDLYYFSEPLHLVDGDVVPPSAYLEATELLHRQYFAYCLDRCAAGTFPGELPGPIPSQLGVLFANLLQEGTWLRRFTDGLSGHHGALVEGFLGLFGERLRDVTQDELRRYAQEGVPAAVATVGGEWSAKRQQCLARVQELNAAITELDGQGHLDDVQQVDLRAMRSERRALLGTADAMGNQETFTGLSELSLLPNYNLVDDATTLDVSLWWTSDDAEGIQHNERTYRRGSRLALREFAPGATFYAHGQKITVDAVEAGPAGNPSWTERRLCASCGWGSATAAPVQACPRCGDSGIADIGNVHRILPFREASAQHSREEAVIDDHAENRKARKYATINSVDVDPADVRGAWRLRGVPFGAEYAARAIVRSLNLGPLAEQGTGVSVAGQQAVKTGFRTCRHCGKWWPVGQEDEVRHRGWCPSRKTGSESWVELVLGHELSTQAVRLLLPVSVFQSTARLAAFKAALLLGLRADFGGDPQHLSVVTASMPDAHGKPRRFLVLHDLVPGGTGYLDRIGDPQRMLAILRKAHEQVATCVCRLEDRAACHRCLLSVLPSNELVHADRALAEQLLDELLQEWDVEEIATVADIDITDVHLNEFEQRFRALLISGVEAFGVGAQIAERMGPKGKEIDLTVPGPSGTSVRWHMRPLVDVVAANVATQPDFLLTRLDTEGADVAVYLDGKAFHASPEHNRTADDARKRDALRSAGYRVWSLTWEDVEAYEALAAGKKGSAAQPLVPLRVQQAVLGAPHGAPEMKPDPLVWGDPMAFLLGYLAEPDAVRWESTSLGLVQGTLQVAKVQPSEVDPGDLHGELIAVGSGDPMPAADPTRTTIWAARTEAVEALPLIVFAEMQEIRSSLSVLTVLDDSPAAVGSPIHDGAWRAWLRWGNVLQFLPLPRHGHEAVLRSAAIWTAGSLHVFAAKALPLPSPGPAEPDAPDASLIEALSSAWSEAIDLADPTLEGTLIELATTGVEAPEVGFEVADGRFVLEVAWPKSHLAVLLDEDPEREAWLHEQGWIGLRHDAPPGLAEQVKGILAT